MYFFIYIKTNGTLHWNHINFMKKKIEQDNEYFQAISIYFKPLNYCQNDKVQELCDSLKSRQCVFNTCLEENHVLPKLKIQILCQYCE